MKYLAVSRSLNRFIKGLVLNSESQPAKVVSSDILRIFIKKDFFDPMEDSKKKERDKRNLIKMKRKMKNMTKEQMAAAIQKKKECNSRAMGVVERLIEPNVTEFWLLSNVYHINQSHFQDVVEERALSKICGYPLCDTALESVPKKQYHISTTQNKVFDLKDRKHYCSSLCYRAGVYLMDQLYTSPLWLRDCEDMVEFRLLKNETISHGVEIDIGQITPVKIEDESDAFSEKETTQQDNTAESQKSEPTVEPQKQESIDPSIKPVEAIKEVLIEKKVCFKRKLDTCSDTKADRIPKSMSDKVDTFIKSWITIESLNFLLGEDEVESLGFKKSNSNLNDAKGNDFEKYYEQLSRKLDIIDISEEDPIVASKPIPDYEKLKNEAKELEIKVKNFYKGDVRVSFKGKEHEESKDTDECLPILPVIDHYGADTTRRKIVLDKLSQSIPAMQNLLNIGHFNLRSQTNSFVHTLALNATNITMRPSEWALMSIVMLHLFSIRNNNLSDALLNPVISSRTRKILQSYGLDEQYLHQLIANIKKPDHLLNLENDK